MMLAFEDVGPGPVVVLLHGFPLDRNMWDGQFGEVGAIYRIIAPDLRGHGESPVGEGISTMDTLADDVIETLDALKLTVPVVLGGHSMGGYVALSIARRYPERLRGLMLINTKAAADSFQAAQVRTDLAQIIERDGTVDGVVESVSPKLFSPTTRERRPDLLVRIREQMLQSPPRGVSAALRGMAERPNRTDELPGIAIPTLVIAGADDDIVPVEEARSMAEAIPAARFAVVSNSGHMSPLENSAETNAQILDFLSSLD